MVKSEKSIAAGEECLGLNKEVQTAQISWRERLNEFHRVIGSSNVYLQKEECSNGECNLGNFFADAILHAFKQKNQHNTSHRSNVSMALVTAGTFRVALPPGNLTYSALYTMCPWENYIYAFTLKGQIIRELLEHSVAPMQPTQNPPVSKILVQVSGIKVAYNISEVIGSRIVDLKVICQNCTLPMYVDLEDEQYYRLVGMAYLLNSYPLVNKNAIDIEDGPQDLEAFINYMQINEPISTGIEGRISILK